MKSGLLPSYNGLFRNLNWAWQDNTDSSVCDAGEQAFLSSWHIDIRIKINFQEE